MKEVHVKISYMEQEVMKTVLQEILQELKEQRKHISHLQEGLDKLNDAIKIGKENDLEKLGDDIDFSGRQKVFIQEAIKESGNALGTESIKHPVVYHTHKHFSILPPNFRMEHFPLLIDTVMKWVVVMVVLLFVIWVVEGKV